MPSRLLTRRSCRWSDASCAGARRLQRARRGQQVSSAHASPRAPPSHFRLRSIGTDPTDCLVLSGARRTTPFFTSPCTSAAGSVVGGCCLRARRAARGGVHSVGSRGRVLAREAHGWAVWPGRNRFLGAAHPRLSRFRHHLFSVAGCLHRLPGIAYCLTTSVRVCVSSVCVPRAVSLPQLARARNHVRAL